jgi:hypothetical protein
LEYLNEEGHLRDLGIHKMIILKLISEKLDMKVPEFNWLMPECNRLQ